MPPLFPAIPPELQSAIEKRRCIPFVGAGMSIPAGMPGFRSLMVTLANNHNLPATVLKDFLDKNDFPGLASAIASHARLSGQQFAQLVLQALNPHDKKPTDNHRLLAELRAPLYVTTNWDNLIEQAIFEQCGSWPTVIVDNKSIPSFDPEQTTVIKIHGDMHPPARLIVTREHYEEYYCPKNILAQLFAPRIATHTFLFLGYSLDDRNIRTILQTVKESCEYDTYHYATVFGNPSPSTVDVFESLRVKVLTIDA